MGAHAGTRTSSHSKSIRSAKMFTALFTHALSSRLFYLIYLAPVVPMVDTALPASHDPRDQPLLTAGIARYFHPFTVL